MDDEIDHYDSMDICAFDLAKFYLAHLEDDKEKAKIYTSLKKDMSFEYSPLVPDGWSVEKNLHFKSEKYCITADISYIIYDDERMIFCLRDDPTRISLMKPELIKTFWLALHIAILIAIDSGYFTAEFCKTCRIKPALVGMKPMPKENFPLAFAALGYATEMNMEVLNLPF